MGIYPKSFFEEADIKVIPGSCFVIMPFGEPYDELYGEVLKECLAENNFSVLRADELYGSKPIMEYILKHIESSEVVIADLTGKNANVFYELGITHSRKSNDNVIIIAQNIDDVPFDLRPYRVILYSPTIGGAKTLKKQLSDTLWEFRLKPLKWMNFTWRPVSPIWYTDDDNNLVAEILRPPEVSIIFNSKPLKGPRLNISFSVLSSRPEVNVMFYSDGRNRYSGYHLWFWNSGIKLRRLESEVKLESAWKLKYNVPYNMSLHYDRGRISVLVDKSEVLTFLDDQPLHEKKGLEFMGFNIHSSKRNHVIFQDFQITH